MATVTENEGKEPSDEDRKARAQLPRLLLWAFLCGVLALIILWWERDVPFAASVLWGLALYATGILAGFIFGIPRVARGDAGDTPSGKRAADPGKENGNDISEPALTVESDNTKKSALAFSTVNSNLVEVSDWLTKIIVGVGLVEFKQLGENGQSLAMFMAGSMTPTLNAVAVPWLVSVAGAIALYFGLLGFITGYLMTRVFLAVVMNTADAAAEGALRLRLPSGASVAISNVLDVFRRQIEDLQREMLKFRSAFTDTGGSGSGGALDETGAAVEGKSDSVEPAQAVPAAHAPKARGQLATVLWVDDRPARNALIIDRLKEAGVSVDLSGSTRDALKSVDRKRYALVITDLHRDGQDKPSHPAGIQLLEALKERFPDKNERPFDVFIYASSRSVEKYRQSGLELGANVVTFSELELMLHLERVFPQLD